MPENVPTPEEGELAADVGRELDPLAFDRSRFYNDMEYGFYQGRHMYQIDKVVSSNAFRAWLAARDRENRAIGWDEGVTAAHDRLAKRVDTEGLIDQHALIKRPVNPYRGDNR